MSQRAECVVTIANALGLHARATAKFVATASRFQASLRVAKLSEDTHEPAGETVGGTSILGLMMLGAAKGSQLLLSAEGEDAGAAIDAVKELINNKFDEGS